MMRSLPISVIPFAGETVQSVYRRLSAHNAVTTGELWTTIRATHPHLPLRTLPELVPRVVEELASLPEGYFDRQNARDRLFVRCVHVEWEHSNCVQCAPLPLSILDVQTMRERRRRRDANTSRSRLHAAPAVALRGR